MMQNTIRNSTLLAALSLLLSCQPQGPSEAETDIPQEAETVEDTETTASEPLLGEAKGDLDGDGIAEWVVVSDTEDSTDLGWVREVRILKSEGAGKGWTTWKSSTNAVLKSGEGGMMGDPFAGVGIKDGVLSLNFAGGSAWKWSYTDKYRFQNGRFELIGYSSLHGSPCEYWTDFDFNLSTGKAIYEKEPNHCPGEPPSTAKAEKEVFKNTSVEMNLQNRLDAEVVIRTPEGREIHL